VSNVTGTSFPTAAFVAALPLTALTVAVVLGATLALAVRIGRHAVVDVAWGLGFVAIAAVAWALSRGHGDGGRRLAVLLMVAIWGVRLATHIFLRSRGQGEDPRYAALLDQASGSRTWFAARRIYLTQGAVMWFVSMPVQVAMFETPTLGVVAWVGVVVWAVGLTFEAVGDWQLTRFRNDPSSRGRVLDTGLWRYTRHPNYFGDATVWWGISLVAFSAWPGPLTVLSPILMTWLLARGTGKPLLEKDMASRRPGYAEYVRRTSGFVPLPPRRG
jgi:steroid 5-alpha reductase family enzyme